jgi:hypothetical protein
MPGSYCHLCGRPIQGRSKQLHHSLWPKNRILRVCGDCLKSKPRCRVCQMPMASATPNNVCPTCTANLHFCLSCGKPVSTDTLRTADYVEIDGVGPYCYSCYRTRPACDVCSAPLTDERWQLSDGRLSCAYCHTTAIYSPVEATRLYDELKTVVANNLGLSLNIPTGLALVDRNQLAAIIEKQHNGSSAPGDILDPQRTLGIYARRGMRRGIYIQTGLPRGLMIQISAHEFGHAWQGENTPLLRTLLFHEGFAEWVAYKVMGLYGYFHQQQRMQDRQDVYGEGLRWALEIETRQGLPGLIETVRRVQ